MSEYLSKKAVLEFIKSRKAKFAGSYKDIEYGAYLELETIETHIESGAFDADTSEIQRLRAALEKARTYIFNGYDLGYIDDREGCTKPLLRQIDEALSTTTEPTNAAKVERVREVVAWFAQQMEAKLRENDHKGGWQDCSLDWLVERLYKEAKELWIEVDRVVPEPERIIREAADVANFAMMIADIARRINAKEKVGTEEWRHKYFGAEWPKVEGDGNDA